MRTQDIKYEPYNKLLPSHGLVHIWTSIIEGFISFILADSCHKQLPKSARHALQNDVVTH